MLSLVIALCAAVALSGPTGIAEAHSASHSCKSEQRAVKRAKRGTATYRRAVKRHQRCVSRNRATAPAPAPVESPAPVETPAPVVVTYPNPNGYVAGQGCLPTWEATFNAAGFSCQFSGTYQQIYLYPSGWVSNKIYVLFALCSDGSYRIC
jgi:hypothetical protein